MRRRARPQAGSLHVAVTLVFVLGCGVSRRTGADAPDATPDARDDADCAEAMDCLSRCSCEGGPIRACRAACDALTLDVPDAIAPPAEESVLELTNEARGQGGCCDSQCFGPMAPLVEAPLLHVTARAYAANLAEERYLSHTGNDGSSPIDRLKGTGFETHALGENLSRGQPSAEAVVSVWLTSVEHCLNVLWPSARYIGVGHARADDEFVDYWVQEIAE